MSFDPDLLISTRD